MDYDFGYEDHLFFSDILSKCNNFLQFCFFLIQNYKEILIKYCV